MADEAGPPLVVAEVDDDEVAVRGVSDREQPAGEDVRLLIVEDYDVAGRPHAAAAAGEGDVGGDRSGQQEVHHITGQALLRKPRGKSAGGSIKTGCSGPRPLKASRHFCGQCHRNLKGLTID